MECQKKCQNMCFVAVECQQNNLTTLEQEDFITRRAGSPAYPAPGCGLEVEFDYPACRVAGWRLLFERMCLVE